jgi:hypothetical protein
LPFFGQNCSLPFSLRSLDIPILTYHRRCLLRLTTGVRRGDGARSTTG